MGLAEDLAEGISAKEVRCRTCIWISEQTPEIRGLIDEWLGSGKSVRGLYRICRDHGLSVVRSSFQEHFTFGHVVS